MREERGSVTLIPQRKSFLRYMLSIYGIRYLCFFYPNNVSHFGDTADQSAVSGRRREEMKRGREMMWRIAETREPI